MEYQTADGSQFSLREVWTEHEPGRPSRYTSVVALVDGKAYAGKLEKDMELLDDEEIAECLEIVPRECINPLFPTGFTLAPPFRNEEHYLKAPSFTYEDCQPGNRFVADCLLNEASILEQLKKYPHPNIVTYHGSVVKDGRISHLCLKKYRRNLSEYGKNALSDEAIETILDGIKAGLRHVHALGLAHNDLNPYNICLDGTGWNPVIIDFDSCLPFGEPLMKGILQYDDSGADAPESNKENDFRGLNDIYDFLCQRYQGFTGFDGSGDDEKLNSA